MKFLYTFFLIFITINLNAQIKHINEDNPNNGNFNYHKCLNGDGNNCVYDNGKDRFEHYRDAKSCVSTAITKHY